VTAVLVTVAALVLVDSFGEKLTSTFAAQSSSSLVNSNALLFMDRGAEGAERGAGATGRLKSIGFDLAKLTIGGIQTGLWAVRKDAKADGICCG